jgi:hypothetical protein
LSADQVADEVVGEVHRRLAVTLLDAFVHAPRQPYVNVARCHDASSYWCEHPFGSTKEPVFPKEIALYAQKLV